MANATGAGEEYGAIPKNPKSNTHNGRTPVNDNADIPMSISKKTESIPESSQGFQPRTAA